MKFCLQRSVRMLRLRSARTELARDVCVETVRPERSELCERSRMGTNGSFLIKRPGSVILFSLMIISIITILTQQLMRGVFVGSSFIKTMIDREHAELLALSGINIAMAQLTFDERDKKEATIEEKAAEAGKEPKAEDKESRGIRKYLARVLPYVNRWQEFELKEAYDGIDGLIRICFTCESGKININEIIDFKKMELKKEYELWLKHLKVGTRIPEGQFGPRIINFFKARKRKLDDISELQNIPGFESLDIFYKPPEQPAKGKRGQPKENLALQDIFTTWSPDDKINPLWLSDGLCAMMGIEHRPCADDPVIRKERFDKFIQEFKKDMAADWDTNWKVLEYLYDKKPKSIPDIKGIFTKEFGAKVFSVLSCGKVGQVEQRVLAVIREEIYKPKADDKQADATKGAADAGPKQQEEKRFRILRIYWL